MEEIKWKKVLLMPDIYVCQWRRHSCLCCFMQRVQVPVWSDSQNWNACLDILMYHQALACLSRVKGRVTLSHSLTLSSVGSEQYLLHVSAPWITSAQNGYWCWDILTSAIYRAWACWSHWLSCHSPPIACKTPGGLWKCVLIFKHGFQ